MLTSGKHCVAAGNGLAGGIAGVASIISVRCRDERNEPRTHGGDVVLVTIAAQGGPTIDAHVIDNTDGTYTCSYLPVYASPFCKVSVTVNGTHLIGSPFDASVRPGPTEARATEVFGPGLYDGVAGRPNHFTIQTKDTYGNRCSEPGDKFCVLVRPLHSLIPEFQAFMRRCVRAPSCHAGGAPRC